MANGTLVEALPKMALRAARLGCRVLIIVHDGREDVLPALRKHLAEQVGAFAVHIDIVVLNTPSPRPYGIVHYVALDELMHSAEAAAQNAQRAHEAWQHVTFSEN